MVLYLHWVAVPIAMVLVAILLIWGMRRDPRHQERKIVEEILSDDPRDDYAPGIYAGNSSFDAAVIEERRLLAELWGNDCPDMVVTWWQDPQDIHPRLSAYQQLFLPFQNGIHDTLATLENHFFDGALEQGVPERSRFEVGYAFVRLPHRGQDMAIRSSFQGSRFAHEFFLADSDGKLSPIHMDTEMKSEAIFHPGWMALRRALGSLEDPSADYASHYFQERVDRDISDSQAHAWLAHLGTEEGSETSNVSRRCALALEFSPDCQVARLERARTKGRTAITRWTRKVCRFVGGRTDYELKALYLFAQSLVALDQKAVAKQFCEGLLLEFPRHPETAQLLRQIEQKERGAQT